MRKRSPRFSTVLHLTSFLVLLYSASMLLPAVMGLLFGEDDVSSFLLTFGAAFVAGSTGLLLTRGRGDNLQTRDGFLVAALFWLTFSMISTTPFYLDARLDLSLADATFEGVSGITTTGASVLGGIDQLPKSVLYYRAQLNFLGGLGIIVLALAVLPFLGIGGAKLYQSEMPGPLKEERFTPRLADTAKQLWVLYLILAFACALAYHLAGMNWFDALCHSLSTVSLGGFSSHDASLGYFDSPAVELVGGIFSILAAVNFSLYVIAVSQRSALAIVRNPEFRFFMLVLGVVVGFTCLELYRSGLFGPGGALVHGFFQATSIMTDNGLGAGNYPAWPPHVVLLLLGASYFGGCVGSTCGGIKAMRFLLLQKQGNREVRQLLHPNAVYAIKVGEQTVPEKLIRSVWGFFFLYIFFACVFVWALVACGHDFVTAFGTVTACLNNMGVGYGDTASGFGSLTSTAKWLMCVAMLFGRLEIFPILVLFSKSFWRY